MKSPRLPRWALVGTLFLGLNDVSSLAAPAPNLLNDQAITVQSATEVEAKRQTLIRE